jgi:hypothetical protein
MTYLAIFIVTGVKGLFHSDWFSASSVSYWHSAKRGRDWQIQHLTQTIEMSCRMIWQVFLILPKPSCHVT